MNTVAQSNTLAASIVSSGKYKYLYGGKDQPYTKALVDKMVSLYPSTFASVKTAAYADADKGYTAIDCSGFVCKVLGFAVTAMGSAQFKSTAVKILSVTKANAKPGMAIWKNGHIAYVGEGLKIYEAAGTVADMKVSTWENRASAFTYLLVVKGSALASGDTSTSVNVNTSTNGNPYTEPSKTVCSADRAKAEGCKTYISSGDGVKWVQYELKESGIKGKDGKVITVDGSAGANTDYAIIAFQKAVGITADGLAGAGTRAKLKAKSGTVTVSAVKESNPYSEPSKNVCSAATAKAKGIKTYSCSGNDVKWVQFELREAGVKGKDGKTISIDGSCGTNTDYAIKVFQNSCKVTADGIVGSTTRAKLKAN